MSNSIILHTSYSICSPALTCRKKMMEEKCSWMVHMEIHHSIFVAFDRRRRRSHSFRSSAHLPVVLLLTQNCDFQVIKRCATKWNRPGRAWILDVTSNIVYKIQYNYCITAAVAAAAIVIVTQLLLFLFFLLCALQSLRWCFVVWSLWSCCSFPWKKERNEKKKNEFVVQTGSFLYTEPVLNTPN